MENTKKQPLSTKRRKQLLDSKVADISYDDLHKMYMTDCRLRGISEITIKGYDFAYTYFNLQEIIFCVVRLHGSVTLNWTVILRSCKIKKR